MMYMYTNQVSISAIETQIHSSVESWTLTSMAFICGFVKPGVEPHVDLVGLVSMKLEFSSLSQGSISTSLHPVIFQS